MGGSERKLGVAGQSQVVPQIHVCPQPCLERNNRKCAAMLRRLAVVAASNSAQFPLPRATPNTVIVFSRTSEESTSVSNTSSQALDRLSPDFCSNHSITSLAGDATAKNALVWMHLQRCSPHPHIHDPACLTVFLWIGPRIFHREKL